MSTARLAQLKLDMPVSSHPMDPGLVTESEHIPGPNVSSDASAQRTFRLSMLVSGIRCVLAYVVLPFATPFLGLAPGVGPVLGLAIATVAIGANVWSMRRFWVLDHRWRKQVTVLHIAVIGFLLVLVALDLAELIG